MSKLSVLGKKLAFFALAIALASLVSSLAFAQVDLSMRFGYDVYRIDYYANANMGFPDAQMHILNPGWTGAFSPDGDLCANIYVFTADQQMSECCSCLVSPNGLRGLSLNVDIASNPLGGTTLTPHAGAIKIVSSQPDESGACDAGTMYGGPYGTLRAWMTHVRNTGGFFTVTETEFQKAELTGYREDDVALETDALHRRGLTELGKLLRLCHDINPNGGQLGSGQGICGCGNEF